MATAVGGVIAAPFLQALASAAGESAYQFIRSRFQRHKKVSELPPGHQVIRLSTLDYRMHVEIPGTVTEEALQAFIDQMPTLLADAPESHVINIHWHGGPEWHRQDME
ncbi:hypothetical protein [Streptomyces sp. NPDC050546]|uniref:hypothetical protein n=1 Tax=Streptomyces sp. NPDC050546 TaxID=3365628 RepID=UPI0037B5F5EC